jgi:hypothetical protein
MSDKASKAIAKREAAKRPKPEPKKAEDKTA